MSWKSSSRLAMSNDPLAEIDCDLAAACHDRHEAWRAMVMRDSTENRQAYAERCAEVDSLLDMRFAYARAERMVDAGS